jgi:indole-3-glycerol phosphate synthase/phosphoribosylanthranilate isomerase
MFLDRIVAQTKLDLGQRKRDLPLTELRSQALAQPQPRDLLAALEPASRVHLIAEVKRASPSKGLLAPHLDPVTQARLYEANGASVISVLTEPHFFLGAPEYLTAIKQAVNIPVLRKDFIVDEYQVYEARAWGADVILLICALLDDAQLRYLLGTAHELGMQCLVEVHSHEEASRAVEAGAIVIGVNSRDLVTFQMNPSLIRDLRRLIPADRILVGESGIHSEADARRLARYDVRAMLVGESLVVSTDVPGQMRMLLRGANQSTQVKICGLRTAEQVDVAVEAGADMLGFIFHEPSHRYVTPQQVRALLEASERFVQPPKGSSRPDVVGVFVHKDADYINEVIELAGLDYVQVYGEDSPELYQQIKRPVIRGVAMRERADLEVVEQYRARAWRVLLDTPTPEWGGSGETHDWELARQASMKGPILLAGGLTSENVAAALRQVHPWGVDVSSGVETERQKDPAKIRAFIEQVRASDANIVGLRR